MEKEIFINARTEFIELSINTLRRIEKYPYPIFKEIIIDVSNIEKDKDNLIQRLEESGINKDSRVLYYIIIESNYDSEIICKKISNYKSKYKKGVNYIAFPKVNHNKSKYVYVGKTNSNFINRFEYHLGIKNGKSTYALHLKEWNNIIKATENLQLKMYYAIIDIKQKDINELELLESCLHSYMKPILGRTGH